MLNLFPIQFLSLLAYFILRTFLGVLLLYTGLRLIRYNSFPTLADVPRPHWGVVWLIGTLEIVAGLLLILGFLTQLGALLAALVSLLILASPRAKFRAYLPDSAFWLLVLGAALSLFITGAGAFAFDLPI